MNTKEMDSSIGTTKWSRNLSEDSQSDSNRLRLLERQRQLLETKLQRQQQVIPTSNRPSTGRPVKSAVSGHRSCEKLIDLEDLNDNGVVNPSISTADERSPSQKDSPPKQQQFHQKQQHMQTIQTVSPLSSPEITSNRSKTQKDSKANLQMNKSDKINIQKANITLDKSISTQELVQLNPLSTILSNEELLLFATQPISPQTTLQCTIIRDKKGLDRSLYPTYYMHLQAIVSNNELDKNEKLSQPSSPQLNDESANFSTESSLVSNTSNASRNLGSANRQSQSSSGSGGYRQVFLLSGRRRKKSKTYIIGNDPFDISRGNCIAKLKSNVLGTQFTAIRMISNGQRQEVASIIYETNVLGFKGPRKMTALIPKYDQINTLSNLSIFEEWKRNNKSIVQLKNKTPIWNDETQSYVLNFHGRVTQASVKNFQLVACNQREDIMISSPTNQPNPIPTPTFAPTIPTTLPLETINSDLVSMQFGRVSNSQFSCDVSWPMSLLQAFAIALSSFDSKLACE